MKLRLIFKLAMAALVLLGGAVAGQTVSATSVEAGNCSSDCRARYSSCLINTRNRSSCNAQLQSCLSGCISGRRRLGGPVFGEPNTFTARRANSSDRPAGIIIQRRSRIRRRGR